MGMKKGCSRVVVLLLAVAWAGASLAAGTSGIQVLSTEYHVYGAFTGYDSYDLTANSPLDESLSLDIGADGSLTDPFLHTSAWSGEDEMYRMYRLTAIVGGQRGWTGYDPEIVFPEDNRIAGPEGSGTAEVIVTFTPVGNFLQVQYDWYADGMAYYCSGGAGVSLEDTTAGVALPPGPWGWPYWSWYEEYWVDPSHVYTARVWADIQPGMDYFFFFSSCMMGSYQVPAPGAVVLGAMGAGLIGLLRRRGMI